MGELRRVGVLSVMKISLAVYLLLGFVVGLFMTLASLFVPRDEMGLEGLIFGPIALIAVPLIYGCLGAVFAGVGALLYNFLASKLGGVQVLILFPVQNPPQ